MGVPRPRIDKKREIPAKSSGSYPGGYVPDGKLLKVGEKGKKVCLITVGPKAKGNGDTFTLS